MWTISCMPLLSNDQVPHDARYAASQAFSAGRANFYRFCTGCRRHYLEPFFWITLGAGGYSSDRDVKQGCYSTIMRGLVSYGDGNLKVAMMNE